VPHVDEALAPDETPHQTGPSPEADAEDLPAECLAIGVSCFYKVQKIEPRSRADLHILEDEFTY